MVVEATALSKGALSSAANKQQCHGISAPQEVAAIQQTLAQLPPRIRLDARRWQRAAVVVGWTAAAASIPGVMVLMVLVELLLTVALTVLSGAVTTVLAIIAI